MWPGARPGRGPHNCHLAHRAPPCLGGAPPPPRRLSPPKRCRLITGASTTCFSPALAASRCHPVGLRGPHGHLDGAFPAAEPSPARSAVRRDPVGCPHAPYKSLAAATLSAKPHPAEVARRHHQVGLNLSSVAGVALGPGRPAPHLRWLLAPSTTPGGRSLFRVLGYPPRLRRPPPQPWRAPLACHSVCRAPLCVGGSPL